MVEATVDRVDGRSLRSGFLRQAAASPDAPALQIGERIWTYGELEQKARTWAHALLATLERPAARVGVLGYRSELSYTGTLAALFAGAAFVPLNPTFPATRTEMMVDLADLDAIVVEDRYVEYLQSALSTGTKRPLVLVPDAEEPVVGLDEPVLGSGKVNGFEP